MASTSQDEKKKALPPLDEVCDMDALLEEMTTTMWCAGHTEADVNPCRDEGGYCNFCGNWACSAHIIWTRGSGAEAICHACQEKEVEEKEEQEIREKNAEEGDSTLCAGADAGDSEAYCYDEGRSCSSCGKWACYKHSFALDGPELKSICGGCRSKELDEEEKKEPMKEAKEVAEPSSCFICQKELKSDDDRTCQCCKQKAVCEKCIADDEEYEYFEWLHLLPVCDVCKKCICSDCMRFCCDCANNPQGDGDWEFKVYCPNCVPKSIVNLNCEYHFWTTCGTHDKEDAKGCGQCQANSNYAGKYGC